MTARLPNVRLPQDSRISVDHYKELRAWMVENDPDASEILQWSADIVPHATAEELAGDIIWIILCAGRSAQAARTIERKVWLALHAGTPVVDVFGYRAKAAAIERAWKERDADFAAFRRASDTRVVNALLAWCRSIPFDACMSLCRPLAEATGDRIAAVDSLLWLACNKGVLRVDREAGAITFDKRPIKAAAIMSGTA